MKLRQLAAFLLTLTILIFPLPARAQSKYYPPPLSFSNAELTRRDFSGQVLRAAEFSNANMDLTNFSNADLRGAIMSASVMTQANLHGANLTNAMVDQIKFTKADLSDAILVETILLRSTFDGVDITGADFTDAIMDGAQVKELCKIASGINSQTGVFTRDSLGCR
jgi:uncharacterized protein YjbI with pentapeptide repeats